jgi:aspartokinase
MKNTVGEVWKFLDSNPCIKRDLGLGLINQRALAKYILKQKKMDVTLDAVISAIRRYELGRQDDASLIARKLISQTINLSTRSGLVKISLVKNDNVQRLLPKLYENIDYSRGEVLRVIQATASIKLLIDESNLEDITDLFPKEKILKITKNIAEINIHMHPKMQTTFGILGVITNELAINGINIVEMMSCFPEMLLFVEEENILKAYQVLYQLCHPKNVD